ncbi:conserved hypothetical protein [Burkholderiales bacterium 8X]|nr:conserved hypothetical protein [Burkholderiales bacterium 8X]
MTIHSNFIGGGSAGEESARGASTFSWPSPSDDRAAVEMQDASAEAVGMAVASALAAFKQHRSASTGQRLGWLRAAADLIEERAPELAQLVSEDVGKPMKAASFEVGRGVEFTRGAAAHLQSMGVETPTLDTVPNGAGRAGMVRRVPYGVVAAITPFNAPVNLLLQKVVPALAAGNAVVAKPHPAGARVALRLAGLCVEAGLPPGLFNVVVGDRVPARALAAHPDVRVVSFTGGSAAAEALVAAAGAKKFVAELGSNSANVVLADADLEDAAKRIASAGFEASGQQCVSAQRVIVEAPVYDDFLAHFVRAARALKVGPASLAGVDVGPMIGRSAADRVMQVARRSIEMGARFALEPVQDGSIVSPGILVDAPLESPIWSEELFGPMVVVQKADDAEHALALANDSPFGLQGALFTRSLKHAFDFAERFDVGALWINEASRFRLDMYPFGGSKASGFGREGIRYAIEEFSQLKFIGIRPL